jgi:dTDP-4-dehydrorhamnose 3,5-epimerase
MAMRGVIIKQAKEYRDSRGWLTELYRTDELPEGFTPAMSYLSVTHPGVARGPHEHEAQTDLFVFLDGAYELHLWENRAGEPEAYEVHTVGRENPAMVWVPPGVVHAYRNVGETDAFVLNFPDKLYAGEGRKEPVDEIRHEADPNSRFQL